MESPNPISPPPTPQDQTDLTAHSSRYHHLPDPVTGYQFYTHLPHNSSAFPHPAIRLLSTNIQSCGSQLLLKWRNRFRSYNSSVLIDAITNRPANQALLTVSNHQSTLDDPGIFGALLPHSLMTDIHRLRWGWCTREQCFPNHFKGWFFLHGKILPIVRGLGLNQRGVHEADHHLQRNEWMHIFPEGKCIPIASGIGSLKWGAAKLIVQAERRTRKCEEMKRMWQECEKDAARRSEIFREVKRNQTAEDEIPYTVTTTSATSSSLSTQLNTAASSTSSDPTFSSSNPFPFTCPLSPLVLPFVHHGMPQVQPFYQPIPNKGKLVRCLVGENMTFSDLVENHERNRENRMMFDYPAEEDLYIAITKRIYENLTKLDKELLEIKRIEEGGNLVQAADSSASGN